MEKKRRREVRRGYNNRRETAREVEQGSPGGSTEQPVPKSERVNVVSTFQANRRGILGNLEEGNNIVW